MEVILHLPLMDHFKVLDPRVSRESPRTKFAIVETVLHDQILSSFKKMIIFSQAWEQKNNGYRYSSSLSSEMRVVFLNCSAFA